LGFIIDTAAMTVEVPLPKLTRTKSVLDKFLAISPPRHKVRTVASVVGKLILLEPALGRAVLVGTRLATILIVAATEVKEGGVAPGRASSPWTSRRWRR
jgi:hypothetical protein